MIFIDNKRQTDFTDEIKQLAVIFPNSFGSSANNPPTPIEIKRDMAIRVSRFRPQVTDQPIGSVVKNGEPVQVATKGYFLKNGVRHEWRYSESFPTVNVKGEYEFEGRLLQLNSGMVFDPERDLEKIIFLWFYSSNFKNNANPKRGGMFSFVIPVVEARNRVSAMKYRNKVENEIINEDARMPRKKVETIMSALGLQVTGVEEQDRLTLVDQILASPDFADRYERQKLNVEAMSAGSSNTEPVDNKLKVIKKLKSQQLLVEQSEHWVLLNENGGVVMTVTDVLGTKAPEKEMNLVTFLSASPKEWEAVEASYTALKK